MNWEKKPHERKDILKNPSAPDLQLGTVWLVNIILYAMKRNVMGLKSHPSVRHIDGGISLWAGLVLMSSPSAETCAHTNRLKKKASCSVVCSSCWGKNVLWIKRLKGTAWAGDKKAGGGKSLCSLFLWWHFSRLFCSFATHKAFAYS